MNVAVVGREGGPVTRAEVAASRLDIVRLFVDPSNDELVRCDGGPGNPIQIVPKLGEPSAQTLPRVGESYAHTSLRVAHDARQHAPYSCHTADWCSLRRGKLRPCRREVQYPHWHFAGAIHLDIKVVELNSGFPSAFRQEVSPLQRLQTCDTVRDLCAFKRLACQRDRKALLQVLDYFSSQDTQLVNAQRDMIAHGDRLTTPDDNFRARKSRHQTQKFVLIRRHTASKQITRDHPGWPATGSSLFVLNNALPSAPLRY